MKRQLAAWMGALMMLSTFCLGFAATMTLHPPDSPTVSGGISSPTYGTPRLNPAYFGISVAGVEYSNEDLWGEYWFDGRDYVMPEIIQNCYDVRDCYRLDEDGAYVWSPREDANGECIALPLPDGVTYAIPRDVHGYYAEDENGTYWWNAANGCYESLSDAMPESSVHRFRALQRYTVYVLADEAESRDDTVEHYQKMLRCSPMIRRSRIFGMSRASDT